MLKPAAYAAEGFLADAEIRCNVAQGHTPGNMGVIAQQVFIPLSRSFEMRIYKTFFQPDIIFLIGNPDQPFNFMKLVEEGG